ncbi:MAG: hypothetical protein QOH49_3915 [Acidobacteriota bacterium]|jgi:hypothetical protein|nr:hypothetical protein [Acidobacteriota bacterium]
MFPQLLLDSMEELCPVALRLQPEGEIFEPCVSGFVQMMGRPDEELG